MSKGLLALCVAAAAFVGSALEAGAATNELITCDVTVTAMETDLSVELVGPTNWSLGNVPEGGVKDTWHDNGGEGVDGPGAFQVKNDGAPADIVVVAWPGGISPGPIISPTAANYALAFASNPNDAAPEWTLCRFVHWDMGYYATLGEDVATHDIIYFDLKFYAPSFGGTGSQWFSVSIEAVASP